MSDMKIPAFASGSFFSRSTNLRQWIALIVSMACALGIYWAGLYGPLLFDDFHNLAPLNDWLQGRTGWQSVVFGNHSGSFGRPVSMATFVANVALSGPGTFGLKLGNLLLHVINGALVFVLFNRLLQLGALTRRSALARAVIEAPMRHRWMPWFGATLWLLHPLLVSTVLYIVQRMAILSAMFTLLAMLAYLSGRVALIDGNRPRALVFLLIGMPVGTLLAALSKENGILAPALCAVLELCIFLPRHGQRRSFGSSAFILAMLVVPALAAIALTLAHPDAIFAGYANRSFTLAERVLTQPRVLWDYIGTLLLPGGARLGLYQDDYPISHGLLNPVTTALAILGWIVAIVSAWLLRKSIPGFAVGLGIFLVGHALESTIFPLLVYFEHRNYLPAVGAIWAIISLLTSATEYVEQRMHQPAHIFTLGAVGLVMALALVTASRASIWKQQDSILADGLRHHPDSRWLQLDLIAFAMGQQPPRVDDARRYTDALRQSDNASTTRLGAVSRLLVDCASGTTVQSDLVRQGFMGRPEPLEADLMKVIESLGDGVEAQPCDGLSPRQLANSMTAMLDRSSLPSSDFGIWRLRFKTASLYLAAGDEGAALQQAKLAYSGGKADPQVAVFIADLMSKQGQLADADMMLDSAALRLAKDDRIGHQVIAQRRQAIRQKRAFKTHTEQIRLPAKD